MSTSISTEYSHAHRPGRRTRPVRLAGLVGAGTAAALVALAAPASAHVTVQPSTVTAGGYATLSFKVPNERDNTSTTGVHVQLPTDAPIASVTVQPKPGWTYKVTRGAPATPVSAHGVQVTEVVTEINWTADAGNQGIAPGEFDLFTISAGALSEDTDQLTFKTIQTYSDGEEVAWIDVAAEGQPEPELPAPVVHLVPVADEDGGSENGGDQNGGTAEPAAGDTNGSGTSTSTSGNAATTASADQSDGTARALGIAGLVVGVVGLGAGGFALLAVRRRPGA